MLERDALLRVRFTRDRGQITSFVVQLECRLNAHWYPVMRYDTAHGFAHCDILKPNGTQEKRPLHVSDFNDALTYAQKDLRRNRHRYCDRFKEWLKHEIDNC